MPTAATLRSTHHEGKYAEPTAKAEPRTRKGHPEFDYEKETQIIAPPSSEEIWNGTAVKRRFSVIVSYEEVHSEKFLLRRVQVQSDRGSAIPLSNLHGLRPLRDMRIDEPPPASALCHPKGDAGCHR